MERRWIVGASAAMIAGVYMGFYLPVPLWAAAVGLILGLAGLISDRSESRRAVSWLLVLCCCGMLLCLQSVGSRANLDRFEGKMAEMTGTAYGLDSISGTFRLHNPTVRIGTDAVRLPLDMLIHLKNGQVADGINGKTVVVRAPFDPIRSQNNPGSFNLEEYRLTQGYQAELRIQPWQIIKGERNRWDVRALLYDIRSGYGKALLSAMPPEQAGIAFGMAIGDTCMIPDELEQSYRLSGLGHILSVSGLHFAILYDVLRRVLNGAGVEKRKQIAPILAVLTAMGFLNGWTAPALRSWGMILLLILAERVHRRYDGVCVLSAVALVGCLLQPLSVLQVGFQLSYGAVLSLFTLTKPIHKLLKLPEGTVGEYLAASLAVQTAIVPLGIFWFGQWSPVGIFTNYPVLIISAWVMPLLAVFPVTLLMGNWFSGIAAQLINQLVLAMNHCSRFLNEWSDRWMFPSPGMMRLGAILILIVLGARILLPVIGGRQSRNRVNRAMLTVALLMLSMQLTFTPGLRITFFDVGQGDAALIQSGGSNILVDAGPAGARLDQVLLRNGVKAIDLMIITHGHEDHIGGAYDIADHLNVGAVWLGAREPENPLYQSILMKTAQRKIPVRHVLAGDGARMDGGLQLSVLGPVETAAGENLNCTSIVLRLERGAFSALMTGDQEQDGEARLCRLGNLKPVSVMKVPHHGSSTSSTAAFLKKLQPRVALVSVGRNLYGHPNRGIMERYAGIGSRVYRTDRSGALTVLVDDFGMKVEPYIR